LTQLASVIICVITGENVTVTGNSAQEFNTGRAKNLALWNKSAQFH